MKKRVIKFPGKILMPVLVFGVFVTACTTNDTNPATTTSGTDSGMMAHTDSMTSDNTHVTQLDTATSRIIANTDSMAKSAKDTSKSNTGKTGKKGKVSILPADTKANTSAMEMDKDGFYKNTEVLPAFPGGPKALERFFEDNIQYPETATENDAQGTVNLIFNVDENGKIYQPASMGNKIGYGIEEEAIRVFNKMPKWTPGKIKGKNVKTRFTLPIRFQLD
ncbi:MAG: energy transducer TonB [Ferruginibacter sp.]